jgi:hypothetical protein
VTPELSKYYEERFSMMSTKGWADLIEDTEQLKQSYDNLSTIKTVDDLYFRQGQLDIINWILNLKQVSEQAFEELNAETI